MEVEDVLREVVADVSVLITRLDHLPVTDDVDVERCLNGAYENFFNVLVYLKEAAVYAARN